MADIVKLLDKATADTAGEPLSISTKGIRGMYGVAQRSGGAATVNLYGRLTNEHTWKLIHSFTGDDAVEIVLFPQMRGEVAGYVSGEIHLSVIGDDL